MSNIVKQVPVTLLMKFNDEGDDKIAGIFRDSDGILNFESRKYYTYRPTSKLSIPDDYHKACMTSMEGVPIVWFPDFMAKVSIRLSLFEEINSYMKNGDTAQLPFLYVDEWIDKILEAQNNIVNNNTKQALKKQQYEVIKDMTLTIIKSVEGVRNE